MKKIIGLLVVFVVLGGIAQAQKIGHVYADKILSDLPIYKKLSAELDAARKERQQALARMDSTYRAEYKRCSQPGLSDIDLRNCQEDLAVMEERIQRRSQEYEQQLVQMQQLIQQQILDTLQQAINVVGKNGGFTYIIDASSTYYVAGGIDLTDKVRIQLGLKAIETEP